MQFIILYLLKLSVSLSVVYLFYQFVLRRLTFYTWNRFYLLSYTALSFLIPFINITPVLGRNDMVNNQVIRFIPTVRNISNVTGELPAKTGNLSWTSWDWLLFFVAAGIIIMLIRLIIQLISFRKIISKAELVSNNDIRLYQVSQKIIPFSFGNSIFINQQLHNDDELTEIIRHEFVHVKQKHTVDIIWCELLCIVNWYNPFAWMIRKAVRQNLEFIADNSVLQSGIDKKEYQYLLLKVIGNNHFSIASQFNFSSLKKRIAMMNKMKSARMHVVKFVFVLPLIAVLLLAFRKNDVGDKMQKVQHPVITSPEISNSTGDDSFLINKKGYNIGIKNEEGKDIVVVKDKYQHLVKEVALTDWNQKTAYFENLYGKGVAEAIDYAVKKSMGLLEPGKEKTGNLKNSSFMREQVNNAKMLHVVADTIAWIASKNKFFFKGQASANDIINNIRVEAEGIQLDWPKSYVSIDGKELDLHKDYISYAHSNYWIITLTKKEAMRKYGSKGENGAVEIISQN